jgi:hypothetical protein
MAAARVTDVHRQIVELADAASGKVLEDLADTFGRLPSDRRFSGEEVARGIRGLGPMLRSDSLEVLRQRVGEDDGEEAA